MQDKKHHGFTDPLWMCRVVLSCARKSDRSTTCQIDNREWTIIFCHFCTLNAVFLHYRLILRGSTIPKNRWNKTQRKNWIQEYSTRWESGSYGRRAHKPTTRLYCFHLLGIKHKMHKLCRDFLFLSIVLFVILDYIDSNNGILFIYWKKYFVK